MNFILIGILMINMVFSTTGDIFSKMWAINMGQKWFWIAMFTNIFTFISFALVIKEGGLAIGSTIALLLTIITTVCIGFFVFKEQISLYQWFGIGLGLISILFILGIIKSDINS